MTDPAFSVNVEIRFSHTDPAGIVYYPHYFDLIHGGMEDWFTHALGVDYPDFVLRQRHGFPTVHAECDFMAPSRMGDRLTLTFLIEKIGRTALTYIVVGHAHSKIRLRARFSIVLIHLDHGKPMAIPDDLHARFVAYQEATRDWHLATAEAPGA
ncbi:MAG: acyl-CoA thioesterase [Rhodospirillales bacterium]|nr:acyl-CoA thioesterase [Rhodospirillales bacterium]